MQELHGIGYAGMEIMADRPHLWPPDMDQESLEAVRCKAEELGLELCNINAFMMKAIRNIHHPSWIEPLEVDRRLRIEHTKECIRLAHALSVPSISTEPGGPLDGMDREKAETLFEQGIRQVLPLSESLGVRLLIEPEPGLLFSGLSETVAFIKRIPSETLGINFDLGHFFCLGQDPAALIRSWSGPIDHVHLEDIAGDRRHHHLIPGLGAMDFESIFEALHSRGYDGFVTVELYPYEQTPARAAEEAFVFLQRFLKP
ncbi:MAG: sugar phosphate isomerase/epimerase family protein [Planctomycetota bacterium]